MKYKDFPSRLKKELYRKIYPAFNGVKEIIYVTSLKQHINTGDHLIYLGEKEFFNTKNIKIKKEFIDSKIFLEKHKRIIGNLPIVIRGGGCFGDVWYDSYLNLEEIVRKYRKNKIIFMPQSILFKDKIKLGISKRIFKQHKNVVIFTRDKVSYELGRRYFKNNSVYFSPDSAFFLANVLKKNKSSSSCKDKEEQILYLDRNDKEKNFNNEWLKKRNILVFDWAIIRGVLRLDPLIFIKPNSRRLIKGAVNFFSNKKAIITSRLHGAILSSLLEKPYILMINNYHKIESFYDSWLKEDPFCKLARNKDELEEHINNLL